MNGTSAAMATAAVLLLAGEAGAGSGQALFTLSIGYNGVPPGTDPAGPIRPLRFADDDAAAFHQLGRTMSRRSHLLALLDRETQVRFPGLAAEARVPSLEELARAVEQLAREITAANRAGEETSVLVFFSGHGTTDDRGRGSLVVHEGAVTQDVLYDRLLAGLPARYVHLIVDACHAETVVRPRDAQAAVVSIEPAQLTEYLSAMTLARFPHVGAMIASAAAAQAHEWDAYGQGVFTHQILSGLRGAADVDGNRRIEYSELAAFVSAANHAVSDPRARLESIFRAPTLNRRAAIVDLGGIRRVARLKGRPGRLDGFFIENAQGQRLVDVRAEAGRSIELVLPPNEDLFLRAAQQEVELRLATGDLVRLETLAPRPTALRTRDAMDASLRKGLFATRFGPAYYRGYVDGVPDLGRIDLTGSDSAIEDLSPGSPVPPPHGQPLWTWAPAGALGATGALFGVLTLDARRKLDRTVIERDALRAQERYDQRRKLTLGLAVGALIAGAAGYWLWQASH